MRHRVLILASVIIAGPLGLVACGSTTIVDTSSSTTAAIGPDGSTPVTTTVLRDPLDEMVRLTLGLGNEISNGNSTARLSTIQGLWTDARVSVDDIDPALGREIDHQLELIATAVERKRPADTDKAARNLAVVVEAIHNQTP
jgi:hypothetical protein